MSTKVSGTDIAKRADMRTILLPVLILSLIPSVALGTPEPSVEKAPLIFAQGEQRLLTIQDLSRYSLGSPVVRSLPLKKGDQSSLLLKAVSLGTGDLWVWKSDGSTEHRRIRVEKGLSELNPALASLEKALGQLQEAEVLLSAQGATLRGEIQTSAEAGRIAWLRDSFPKEVLDTTTLAPELMARADRSLEDWIKGSPFSEKVRTERIGTDLWLRGSLENDRERQAVERRARALFSGIRLDLATLPDDAPTVHFKVFLLELKKTRFQSLGLGWPAFQESALRVTTNGIQDLIQLDLTLNALQNDGSVRILSNPEIAVRAPGEAELFSGGELPIQNRSQYYSDTTWKNFGLMLKLKVAQTTGTKVRLDIFTEVSHLDPNLANENKIPGLQSNRMKTQVDARYGRPLFLSGLLQQNMRDSVRGLPYLKDIPILGKLFGSSDYLEERSELVAILLPATAPPDAPMDRFELHVPRGPLPMPRNWVGIEEERALRASPGFPWNAL